MSDIDQKLVILDSKNLFIFPDSMTLNTMDAALDSHTFAVQAANAQYHPMKQTQQWLEYYIEIMQKCGWVPYNFELTQETSSAHHLDMSNLLAKGLMAAAGLFTGGASTAVAGAAVVEQIKNAVTNSKEAIELFDRQAHEVDTGCLRLAKCDQSDNGQVVMLVSAVQTDAIPDTQSNILLFKWKAGGATTYTSGAALYLHRSLYESNKDVIRQRIGAEARDSLLSIPLKG